MVDPALLRDLVPLHEVSDEKRERLAQLAVIDDYPKGAAICREGDGDNLALYLIEGGVELATVGSTMKRVIQAGSSEATFPLAHSRPRQFTVTALTPARILKLDNRRIDRLLVFDEITTAITTIRAGGEVRVAGDTEWLEEMMQAEAFQRIPRENLGALVLRMEPLAVRRGETVFRQGDPGDYYYVVKEGRFTASRKDEQGKVRLLHEFAKGSVFGEESLISGEARQASIVAMSDGTLMRLARRDFDELLRKPLLAHVTLEEARELVRGGAGLLDVRAAAEFARQPLKGASNLPVSDLSSRVGGLDVARRYVVVGRTSEQAEVAAFWLAQRGFDVRVLAGGIEAHQRRG